MSQVHNSNIDALATLASNIEVPDETVCENYQEDFASYRSGTDPY